MRNKRIIRVIFLTSLVFLSFIIQPRFGKAITGTYEARTDSSNPFLFQVDMIYYSEDDTMDLRGPKTHYHEVVLKEDTYYMFFMSGGPIGREDVTMEINCKDSPSIDSYTHYFDWKEGLYTLLLFEASLDGTYEMRINMGDDASGQVGFTGIGILRPPIYKLNQKVLGDYWDFSMDPISAGFYETDEAVSVQAKLVKNNTIHSYYSQDVYYYSMDYFEDNYVYLPEKAELTNTSETRSVYIWEGYTLFYAFTSYGFGFSNRYTQPEEEESGPTIQGYQFLLFGVVGLITVSSIIHKSIKKDRREC